MLTSWFQFLHFPLVAPAILPNLLFIPLSSPALPWSKHMTWSNCTGQIYWLQKAAPFSISPTVSALIISPSPSTTLFSLVSSDSSSIIGSPPLSIIPLTYLVPSATLLAPITLLVDAYCASPIILLCRAALVASVFFTHLVLNIISFPFHLGDFFRVWPEEWSLLHHAPCYVTHWSLLWWWTEY